MNNMNNIETINESFKKWLDEQRNTCGPGWLIGGISSSVAINMMNSAYEQGWKDSINNLGDNMKKPKVINLYAGPGTGKSTTCAALFAELKYQGVNTEMILEYAKEAAWENRGPKLFNAQEYIFGKQHFRMSRVAPETDFVVTDSPLLLGLVYMPVDFKMPSLKNVIKEAYDAYDNINIFLKRNKPYNPKGRNQSEDKAKLLDIEILEMLDVFGIRFVSLEFGRENVKQIIDILKAEKWI